MVSVIIRTKNEERWISSCLEAVFAQEFKDIEVIIVDSHSSDKTVEKAKQFPVKVIYIDNYLPGKALNMGIRVSRGEYICCLSAHCIPTNEKWMSNLLCNFSENNDVAGVYGRQEPMSFSSDFDKRDLLITFGLDRRVQIKDSFFHNANSMIRRDIWEKIPFDEHVTNIEDRVWAENVIKAGYKLIYEPEASVYHYHGIHQNADPQRCRNIVRILERFHGSEKSRKHVNEMLQKMNVVAIIPVKGEILYLGKRPLIEYTIERAKESRYIKKVIVSTDNKEIAKISAAMGAEAPFLRDPRLSAEYVDLEKVLQFSLEKIEELKQRIEDLRRYL